MSNTITMEGGNFSTIPNELLNNASISLSAKGMYVFMRGKPAAWNFTIRSMAKQLKEGETAISNALNELKKYGWVSYTKLSNGKGVYHLFWSANPESQEDHKQGNPDKAEPKPEKPNQGFPMKGKPQRISKKEPIVKQIDSNTPNPQGGDEVKLTAKAKAQAVVDLYNEVCGDQLPKAIALNPKRQRQIENVCKIKLNNGKTPFANYNLKAWRAYFDLILENKWNLGENPSNWKADIDYVIRPDTVIKTLERKYA